VEQKHPLRGTIHKGCEVPDETAAKSRRVGRIVTFYSFKGGTGRTMALANVAWILAANGKRVLVADWDLESPGLHRFFQPFMEPEVSAQPGIVDFIRGFEWAIDDAERAGSLKTDEKSGRAGPEAVTELIEESVRTLSRFATPVDWRFPDDGVIHFLSPGKQDNGVYKNALSALDWDTFYEKLYGGEFLDALRAYLRDTYDYVLIDSRTGMSDIADICTLHLPDMVIDCFTLSTQGIEGAAEVAGLIRRNTLRPIEILPVPMRIDHAREDKVVAGMDFAEQLFAGLPEGLPQEQWRDYWAEVEVPYRPAYAYEETLAAFGDRPGTADSLLASYERITARLTDNAITRLPPRQEWLRLRTWRKFSRTLSATPPEIMIDFSPQDQLWAEWIAAVLAGAGLAAGLVGEQPGGMAGASGQAQVVAVLTDSYVSRLEDLPPGADPLPRPDLLISLMDTRSPWEEPDTVPEISLADLSETEAVDRLIEHFEGVRPPERESITGAMRYPADGRVRIDNLLTRNSNFTGRDAVLRQLREELRSRGRVVVLQAPTIQGLGGVGKTQVALEYAHRFKEDYDVTWWLSSDPSQYVDASLVDLGKQLRDQFGANVPEEGGADAVTRRVLQFLAEEAPQRWLLIYDNAEAIKVIEELLPRGGGHVLITSRNEGWEDRSPQGKMLRLGYFERPESISHLRRRLPDIDLADANELATELGDMPLAVAAAGALLAIEGTTVPDYLRRLRAQPVRQLPDDHPLRAYPEAVAKAWHLSLDALERRSTAAARLLRIWAVMGVEISLDLIYSDAMVGILRELDSGISEPAMITRLVNQIDRLALIKVEYTARQVVVHRVVQTVVRERMSDAELEIARYDAHTVLVAARPKGDVDDPKMWPAFRQIWPHLRPSQAELDPREQIRDLLLDRVRYHRQRGALEAGLARARTIENAWIPWLEAETDAEIARTLRKQLYRLQFNAANILRDLGRFAESRALDEKVLRGQRELLGDEYPHTLATRSSLAADARALGDYQEALALDQATYDSWALSSGFGDDYAGTLMAANNLALSSLVNGDFRDALRRDRQTLKRRVELYGSPGHPRALDSGIAVARDLIEAGRYREATRMMTEVAAQAHDSLGDDARIALIARLWLGTAQRCAGDPGQAAENIRAAVTGLVAGFGSLSTDALAGRLSLALNELALGQSADGRKGVEEVLAAYERRLRSNHPNVLICKLNMASALCLDEDYSAAKTYVDAAANGLRAGLGQAHPYTLAANFVQANVLVGLGRVDEALEVQARVLAERTKVLGGQHPDTLRSVVNLLLTERQRGSNGPTAELKHVTAELADALGANHPDVAAAVLNHRLSCVVTPQPF
jgi:tetratricopeptide (TPR) repeat protein